MKIPVLKQLRTSEGSVLLISLVTVLVLLTSLFSYLSIVEWQNRTVYRSEAWNTAMAVAEAGVEEALAQMNPGAAASPNLAGNGWGGPVSSVYGPVTRSYTDGKNTNTYSVAIVGGSTPTINSTGRVYIASLKSTITRALQVTTYVPPLTAVALAAKNGVNLGGNNMYTDSFNSSSTNYSLNGRYDAARALTNGAVASLYGIVDVGNSDIHGDLYLGPTATYSIKNNGSVSGTISSNYNYIFADVQAPTNAVGWPEAPIANITTNGTFYKYVITTAGQSYKISTDGSIYIGPGASGTTLYMNQNFSSTIRVATNNAGSGSVTNYMNGQSFTLSGNTVVDGGLAKNFTYYGTSNNTSITFSGNAAFTGTIYAPRANVTMNGGGNTQYDIVGSIIVNSITSNGHFNVHFDEELLNNAPPRIYTVSSWKEF